MVRFRESGFASKVLVGVDHVHGIKILPDVAL